MICRYAIVAGLFTCLATAGIVLAQPANRERAFGEAPRTFAATDANEAAADANQEAAEEAAEAHAEVSLDQRVDQLSTRVSALERNLPRTIHQFADVMRSRGRFGEESVSVPEFKIFTLKKASSEEMARLLTELFGQNRGPSLRVAADSRTNSVVVGGDAETLKSIEAILIRLDEMDDQ